MSERLITVSWQDVAERWEKHAAELEVERDELRAEVARLRSEIEQTDHAPFCASRFRSCEICGYQEWTHGASRTHDFIARACNCIKSKAFALTAWGCDNEAAGRGLCEKWCGRPSVCPVSYGRDAEKQAREKAEQEVERLRTVLIAVDEWDLNWADGLDSNVERIKTLVRAALEG